MILGRIFLILVVGLVALHTMWSSLVNAVTRSPDPEFHQAWVGWSLPPPDRSQSRVAFQLPGSVRVVTGDGVNEIYNYNSTEVSGGGDVSWSESGRLLIVELDVTTELAVVDTVTGEVFKLSGPSRHHTNRALAIDDETIVFLAHDDVGWPQVVFWSLQDDVATGVPLAPLEDTVATIDVSQHVSADHPGPRAWFGFADGNRLMSVIFDEGRLRLGRWPLDQFGIDSTGVNQVISTFDASRNRILVDIEYHSPFTFSELGIDEWLPSGACAGWTHRMEMDMTTGEPVGVTTPTYAMADREPRSDWIAAWAFYDPAGQLVIPADPKNDVTCQPHTGWWEETEVVLVRDRDGEWIEGPADPVVTQPLVGGGQMSWHIKDRGLTAWMSDHNGEMLYDGRDRQPLAGSGSVAIWPQPIDSASIEGTPIDGPVPVSAPRPATNQGGGSRPSGCAPSDLVPDNIAADNQVSVKWDISGDGVSELLILDPNKGEPFNLTAAYILDPDSCQWLFIFGNNPLFEEIGDSPLEGRDDIWCIGDDNTLYAFGGSTIWFRVRSGYIEAVGADHTERAPSWDVCREIDPDEMDQ